MARRLYVEERRRRSDVLAHATMACPGCDAPVLPGAGGTAPPDVIACPYCAHAAPVRDFVRLEDPVRPARVVLRVRG